MFRSLIVTAMAVFVVGPAFAATLKFEGKVILKDSGNDDAIVGDDVASGRKSGLPAGNTLKVTINAGRYGTDPASNAEVTTTLYKGSTVLVEDVTFFLSESGYGEATIETKPEWSGQFHVEVVVSDAKGAGRDGRLQEQFRITEEEPQVQAPDGLPLAFLALGAMMMVFWMRRTQTAPAA
jgi:hypothetical protein